MPRTPPAPAGAAAAPPALPGAPSHHELAALLADRAQALRTALAAAPPAELGYRTPVPGPSAGPGRLSVTAELAARVAGYDAYPVVHRRRLELVHDGPGGGWRVAHEEGAGGGAPLWDFGPLRAAQGRHCLVLGLADGPDPAGPAAVADRAVPAVNALWGTAWAGRLLLELPATGDQFARLLDVRPADWADMAAVTTAAPGAPHTAPADRIVVNPEAYERLSAFGRQVVLTHEAVHVATRADTRPWTPLWLSEGVADWTGYRDSGRTARQIAPELARDVAEGRVPTELPADAAFTAGSGGIAQAYEQSWLACDLIARRHGPERLVALYRAVGAAGPGIGREQLLDRVLRAELGLGLGEFTAHWVGTMLAQLRA
ncbi:hypothetical protein ACWGB8_09390 [Kitasatospora sp. NPDC054939]